MNARILTCAALAVVLLAGCSGSNAKPTTGSSPAKKPTGSSSVATPDEKTRGVASYTALAPDGALESKAIASVGAGYKTYLKNAEQTAKQSPSTVVYRDGNTVKPLFLGYKIDAYSDKLTNGKFNMTSLLVLDGVVTSYAAWVTSGEMTMADINPQYFVYEVPSVYTMKMAPDNQRQKDAIAQAKAWLDTNFAAKKLTHAELTAFVFAYGQPADAHYLLMDVNPANPGAIGAAAK